MRIVPILSNSGMLQTHWNAFETIEKGILVIDASGFWGRQFASHLPLRKKISLFHFDLENTEAELYDCISKADVVFDLATVNRPQCDQRTGRVGRLNVLRAD